MHWRAWNKMLVVSFSLAAAGILACVGALLESFVPPGSVLAALASMAGLGVAIVLVLAGFVWACDKCEEVLSRRAERHSGTRPPEQSETSTEHWHALDQTGRHRTTFESRPATFTKN